MSAELENTFTKAEIASAIEVSEDQIIKIKVDPLNADVPGFSSQILRMTVSVKEGEERRFVVKRLPAAESLVEIINENDIFLREVRFFQKAYPELKKNVHALPIVRCFLAKANSLLLEDLCAKGYIILAKSMNEVGKNLLSLGHARLAIQKLACFHAASFGVNWLQVLPELKTDCVLEKPSSPFPTMIRKAYAGYAKAIPYFFPSANPKYANWLLSDKSFETLYNFVKPDPVYPNLLGHADFWVNNIMFRENIVSQHPEDVIFIDFQTCRYVPGSRDIHNLLYTCMDKNFRDSNQAELIEAYVESFNRSLDKEQLTVAEFTKEYEHGKLFGVLVGIVFRSMNLMPDLYPKKGEEMGNDMFEAMVSGRHFDTLIERCCRDEYFCGAAKELVLELMEVLNKRGV